MENQVKEEVQPEKNPPFRKFKFPNLSSILIIIALIVGIAVVFVMVYSANRKQAYTNNQSRASENVGRSVEHRKFENIPEKGLIWDGLREPVGDNSPCKSKDKDEKKDLLEIFDEKTGRVLGCTHGPDPAPQGVDVRKRVEPLQSGNEPNVLPVPVRCDGDGVSGNRVQVIYARASDKPDRYSQYLSSIQAWAADVDNTFVESGLQTGSARHVRFVHDANCYVKVDNVVLPPAGDNSMADTELAMQALGYDRGDRKYLIYMDANTICGQADLRIDSQPGPNNMNNYGSMWARIDNGCWNVPGRAYAAHELMHNMGAVQSFTPNNSGRGHCTDDYDVMCYEDDPSSIFYGGSARIVCSDSAQELRFDCNKDDYFNTGTPPAGSYLETNWNTANNIFLIPGPVVPITPTTVPSPTPVDTFVPSTPSNLRASSKPGRINLTWNVSTDTGGSGLKGYQVYRDGSPRGTLVQITSLSDTVVIKNQTYIYTVRAFDNAGNFSLLSNSVTVKAR